MRATWRADWWKILGALLVVVALVAGCAMLTPTATPTPTPTATPTPTPTPTATPTPTPAPGTLYEDWSQGFSFRYPEGWTKAEAPVGDGGVGVMVVSPDGKAMAGVYAYYFAEKTTPEQFMDWMMSQSGMGVTEPLSTKAITLADGTPAVEVLMQSSYVGAERTSKAICLVRETQGLIVYGTAESSDWDAYEEEINGVLSSLRLLPFTGGLPTPTPTPAGMGFYRSEEYGFSISYPASWSEMPISGQGDVFSVGAPGYMPGVMVIVMPSGGVASAAQMAAGFIEGMKGVVPDMEVVSQGAVSLDDGTPAYEFVYRGTPPSAMGMKLEFKILLVVRGDQGFMVEGYSMPEMFAGQEEVIDSVLYSFHLE